jgi:uncharacterized membrane protein
MTKQEFLHELRRELERIPFDERENAVRYYEEYFEDAGPENEQKVLEELGDPKEVARQVFSDFAVKGADIPPKTAGQGISKVWIVLLAIFSAPVALPVAVVIAVCVICVIVLLIAAMLVLAVGGLALVLAGILSIILGFSILIESMPSMIFYVGSGLGAVGGGLLLGYFSVLACVKAIGGVARGLARYLKRKREVA